MSASKLATLGLWLVLLLNLYQPMGSWDGILTAAFWLLVIVHAIEVIVFVRRYSSTGEPMLGHALSVFVFGVAHTLEVRRRLEGKLP